MHTKILVFTKLPQEFLTDMKLDDFYNDSSNSDAQLTFDYFTEIADRFKPVKSGDIKSLPDWAKPNSIYGFINEDTGYSMVNGVYWQDGEEHENSPQSFEEKFKENLEYAFKNNLNIALLDIHIF